MIIDEIKFTALAIALFGMTAAEARQLCTYTTSSEEIGKPLELKTITREMEPVEMSETFFNIDSPVVSYSCKPIPREKKK